MLPRWDGGERQYIASAYWFTSSTSFANPAVTIARALTNTSRHPPDDVLPFILAQALAPRRRRRCSAG